MTTRQSILKRVVAFILGIFEGAGRACLFIVAMLGHLYLLRAMYKDIPITADNTQGMRTLATLTAISMFYVTYLLFGRPIIAAGVQSYNEWKAKRAAKQSETHS